MLTFKSLKSSCHPQEESFTINIERKKHIETIEPQENIKQKLKCNLVFEQKEDVKSSKYLEQFHKELEKYHNAILQRYGWHPKVENRIANDKKAHCLVFAVAENHEVAALLSVMKVDADEVHEMLESQNKHRVNNLNDFLDDLCIWESEDEDEDESNYEYYELAMAVLPPFQRCGIATKLVKQTWNKIGHKQMQWIAVINSMKSKRFMQSVKEKFSYIPVQIVDRQ